MGPETSLFTMALGLQAPWSVTDVRFDAKLKGTRRLRPIDCCGSVGLI